MPYHTLFGSYSTQYTYYRLVCEQLFVCLFVVTEIYYSISHAN